MAGQLISRIRKVFSIDLPLRELFTHATISGLSERIEAALEDGLTKPPPMVPVSRDQAIPLSYAQQRLWLLEKLEGRSTTYNISAALRLSGPLDKKALKRSLVEILSRHESLRTTFKAHDNDPVQVVGKASRVVLPLRNLQYLEESQRLEEVRTILADEASRSFDLERGPLFRILLLQIGPQDHVLAFSMHHIISDGWSTGLLIRELSVFYQGFVAGGHPPGPSTAPAAIENSVRRLCPLAAQMD